MEMVINKDKSRVRKRILGYFLSLTEEEIKRRSENVEEKLSELSIYRKAETIMAYYPLRDEVNILGMIDRSMKFKRFCFPSMDTEGGRLKIFEVRNLSEDFTEGPFGVHEPDEKKTREVDKGEIDLIIVPGLAFDRHKNRLGRGAGFYDRFLEEIPPCTKKVGIAFDFQILENLPIHHSFDQKVDLIVTETGVV
ncbi:MAG: 5-formyltetrahydrofolate cyclo-ligase [Candidatus Omnitrophica bacterium]|nr:5-formyltetrahydrofolate cyclo-ligase [Candidatus Omnitrophota bacterium]MBD3268693.1 5-formyltetrahydrofolate cyclo-ligase [Candidatus Omnitrophota bacterium]